MTEPLLAQDSGASSQQRAANSGSTHPVITYLPESFLRNASAPPEFPQPAKSKREPVDSKPELGFVHPDAAAAPVTYVGWDAVCGGASTSSVTCESLSSGQVLTANHYGFYSHIYVGVFVVGYGSTYFYWPSEFTLASNASLVETDFYCASGGSYVPCANGQPVDAFVYWYDVSYYLHKYSGTQDFQFRAISFNAPSDTHDTSVLGVQH